MTTEMLVRKAMRMDSIVGDDKGLQKEIARLDEELNRKYLRNTEPIPDTHLCVAHKLLEDDISSILLKAEDMDSTFEEIIDFLSLSSIRAKDIDRVIDYDRALENAKIRRNFAEALEKAKRGSDLSFTLRWSFTDDDLTNLARLHKSRKYRKKIEDLLTDCNFHSECSAMANGDYSEWGL